MRYILGCSPHIVVVYWWIYQHFKQLQRDMEFLLVQRGSHVDFNYDFISLLHTWRASEISLHQLDSRGTLVT